MIDAIREILRENERRNAEIHAPFNPYTGEGAVGERRKVALDDFPIRTQYLPVGMLQVPLVAKLIKAGSIEKFMINVLNSEYSETERMKVIEQFVRVRIRYDFCFWAAMFVYIKNKGGGETCSSN